MEPPHIDFRRDFKFPEPSDVKRINSSVNDTRDFSENSTDRDRGVIANPHFADLHSRLDSFANWPKPEVETELLANAGFFFEGKFFSFVQHSLLAV